MAQMTARTDPFGDLFERFTPRDTGRFPASSASIVDPATIVQEVFNVDFTLDSPEALIAQLRSAVRLEDEETTGSGISPRTRGGGIGPFVPVAMAAQVLQDNVVQLSTVQPIEAVRTDGCDHQTILPLIHSSVAAIVKELTRPEPPLIDRVNAHLATLSGYRHDPKVDPKPFTMKDVGGDLGTLFKRLALDRKACSVHDERTLTLFSNVVQFTNMVVQSWHAALKDDRGYITIAIHGLQRSLRGIVVTAEWLQRKVPAAAWITNQVSDPPIVVGDLYQWVYSYASEGAIFELKRGGRDGIRTVNGTMKDLRALVDKAFRGGAGVCSKAFEDDDVKKIVDELVCHMDEVIRVTGTLL